MDPSIIIVSDDPIPDIERAIQGFLGGYPGTWHIQINQRLAGGWWSVMVKTEGYRNIFLIRPGEQTADGIVGQLREALRGAQARDACPWDGTERRARPRF
jgi:hypothetical protein